MLRTRRPRKGHPVSRRALSRESAAVVESACLELDLGLLASAELGQPILLLRGRQGTPGGVAVCGCWDAHGDLMWWETSRVDALDAH